MVGYFCSSLRSILSASSVYAFGPLFPLLLSWKGVAGVEDEERSWGGEGMRAGRRKVDS